MNHSCLYIDYGKGLDNCMSLRCLHCEYTYNKLGKASMWKINAIFSYVNLDHPLKKIIIFFLLNTIKYFSGIHHKILAIHIPGKYIKAVHKEGIIEWSEIMEDCLIIKTQPGIKYDCSLKKIVMVIASKRDYAAEAKAYGYQYNWTTPFTPFFLYAHCLLICLFTSRISLGRNEPVPTKTKYGNSKAFPAHLYHNPEHAASTISCYGNANLWAATQSSHF